MNENPYASPVEVPETLAEYVPSEMRWVKRGMVWIAGSIVTGWAVYWTQELRILPFSDSFLYVTFLSSVMHLIGVAYCGRCPDAVVKSRKRLIGWSVFLAGISIFAAMGSVFLSGFFSLSQLIVFILGSWSVGTWIWMVFLLRLTRGIRAERCGWLVWMVLIAVSLEIVLVHTGSIPGVDYPLSDFLSRGVGVWAMRFNAVAYPLLILGIWWRLPNFSAPADATCSGYEKEEFYHE